MQLGGRQSNFNEEGLWARGYVVSTIGLQEANQRVAQTARAT